MTDSVIRPTRPTAVDIDEYRREVELAAPTYPQPGDYRTLERRRTVGRGERDLGAGADVIRAWQMHTAAGVEVASVPIAVGQTVVMSTSMLGMWLVFGCRITDVTDTDDVFGFTYVTLPGHPEQGEETFVVSLEPDGDVVATIRARSRPAMLLGRLAGPIGRRLQQRYAESYVDAIQQGIRERH